MNTMDAGVWPKSSSPGYGAAAKVMRDQGLADAHPGHQVLRELVEAGVAIEDFEQIAVEASTRGKGFAWALAALKGRREDAARGYRPSKRDHAAELREWAPFAALPSVADGLPLATLEDWPPRQLPSPTAPPSEPASAARLSRSKPAPAAPGPRGGAKPPRSLKLVRAMEVATAPSLYTDEIIERVLGRGAMSCLYGPSNAGKSYVALDMACAVALGVPWMGRRTRRGLVLYLATEGGSSICDRVKAYRIERGEALDLLMIVSDPIDLREDDSHAALLDVIERAEKATGEKVALIVADTLAAMTPGADENSGKDMGPVLQRAQEIVQLTGAHWLWIHHTGKDTAKGMRGWSGMFAALDTVIELDDDQTLTVTKQRSLPGKGDRYAFELKEVHIGRTDFGAERFAHVVEPKGASPRSAGKLVNTAPAIAITQLLRVGGEGMNRADIERALRGQPGCSKANLFKAIISVGDIVALPAPSAVDTP